MWNLYWQKWNNMPKWHWVICLLLVQLTTYAQPSHIADIPCKASWFTTDHLGNIYTLEKNHIVKYSKDGEKQFFFSTNKFGDVSLFDAQNPYKILVFFEAYSTFLILDNTLTLNGEPIDMLQKGLETTHLMASSYQNGIWLYDALQMRLIRYNGNMQQTINTANLTQVTGIELNPNFMLEYNNFLYLNNPATGILVFDIFGAYIKTIPIKNLSTFQVLENEILYFTNHTFFRYHLKTGDSVSEKMSDEIRSVRLEKQRKYLLLADKIQIFSTGTRP